MHFDHAVICHVCVPLTVNETSFSPENESPLHTYLQYINTISITATINLCLKRPELGKSKSQPTCKQNTIGVSAKLLPFQVFHVGSLSGNHSVFKRLSMKRYQCFLHWDSNTCLLHHCHPQLTLQPFTGKPEKNYMFQVLNLLFLGFILNHVASSTF